ncbi:MBL fold metallo-hydrolase [Streptomyces sp. NBC_00385]|uniref:MBL fold metallo-hydrolase n=1 Tax=Streptomyces sp. NBC_00385 TaxID=2975733 RepID=UPI002DD91339|nr:MBL fold metallo-hydrolase [Streptomyces sp. NBC_00385]WRZ06418.1 MBL fold metallo-hydrolase [Streptomyces sp. NBC_00385]
MNRSTDGLIDFTSGTPAKGSLDVAWIHGTADEPRIQVHHYDEHTVILRQSKRTNYEAPFLFLLFGNERALLLDTGATADPELFPLRTTVDRLITEWLDGHPRERYGLVVAHTHGHGDHVAADAQFADRPETTVVAREEEAVRSFFGFGDRWPTGAVTFDLGGRALGVLGSPGHHRSAITVHDPWTGIMFTGDTVLPGRLYAFDFTAFRATLARLVVFAEAHTVVHVLGCHIEMTSEPGRDYPLGATYQPDERALQLTAADLAAVRDAAEAVAGRRGIHRFDDFVLYNEPRPVDQLRLMARGLAHKLRSALTRRRRTGVSPGSGTGHR